jgi:hypothetical protein
LSWLLVCPPAQPPSRRGWLSLRAIACAASLVSPRSACFASGSRLVLSRPQLLLAECSHEIRASLSLEQRPPLQRRDPLCPSDDGRSAATACLPSAEPDSPARDVKHRRARAWSANSRGERRPQPLLQRGPKQRGDDAVDLLPVPDHDEQRDRLRAKPVHAGIAGFPGRSGRRGCARYRSGSRWCS